MAALPLPELDSLLRLCAESAPRPWRPAEYARGTGIDRDSLDEPLNCLRLAGLVRLTDWEPGVGQGYILTDAGVAAMKDPAALIRLRAGTVAPERPTPVMRRTSDAFRRGEQVRAAVFEAHPLVNRALIGAQVVVFAAGLYLALTHKISLTDYLTSGRSPLSEYLAISPPHLARGDWWVLLTSAFVHLGGLHLFVNLTSMAALGPAVEGMLGSGRYLGFWLISALGGSVFVAARGQAAAGSSGVVCGLIGAQAAFVAIYHSHLGRRTTTRFREWFLKTMIVVVAFSLLPMVSGAAHLGGGIAGALAGGLLAINRFGRPIWRGPALIGVVALPLLGVGYLTERGILGAAHTPRHVAAVESADFMQRLRPLIQQVDAASRNIEDDVVEPLRSMRVELRPREEVQSAINSLRKLESDESRLLETVIQTGHYRTPAIEAMRHAAETLLELRLRVATTFEECLRRGDMWILDRDETQMQILLNLALEAEIAYHRAAAQVLVRLHDPGSLLDVASK